MFVREDIIKASIKYDGDWDKISQAISNSEVISLDIGNVNCITILDKQYPVQLKGLRYPPWVLFYEGDISLLSKPMITIIGSRDNNEYGELVTRIAVKQLSKHFVIVSGLAKGVDGIAHEEAITRGGKTIGVIGSGLNTHYPKINEYLYSEMSKNHLIVSEYPPNTPIKKEHFPWRNRILACLGQEIIVTQAKIKSGTMLTVNEALALSKQIWCVPYPFEDESGEGCNHLISQGAQTLYNMIQLREIRPKKHLSCQEVQI